MKLKLLRWLLPAIVPAALMLGAASSAHAVSYECDGPINPVPTNVSGSVEINVTGDCTIDHDVTATGQIQINVTGGKLDARQLISVDQAIKLSTNTGLIKARKISAGTTVEIFAGDDNASSAASIEVNDVISNTKDVENINANIILKAQGFIKTKDIKANGTLGATSKKSGGIQIDANMAGDNALLTVGGAGGIDGIIDTRSKLGGGTELQRVGSGIRITNGTLNSTGGITVTDLSKLRVRNTESRSGQVELNANKGTLTLPSGELNVSEQSNKGAGFIFLLAQKIVTGDGTRLLANQGGATPGYVHQVIIAAQTIEYQGAGGLSIEVDGKGAFSTLPATIYVVPQGGIKSESTTNIANLLWTRTFNGTFFSYPGEVHFNGGANSPLVLRAHGDNSQIVVTGYPVKFNGGNVTISSRGDGIKNEVILGYGNNASFNGSPGVTFDNTGTVLLTAKGLNNANRGGLVQVQTDLLKFKATSTLFQADANDNGNADGGRVIVIANAFNQDSGGTATFTADAASNALGNGRTDGLGAVYVVINAVLQMGDQPGQLKITSTGGGSGGNGGKVAITAQKIVTNSERSINASASGGNGDGGEIVLTGILEIANITVENIRAKGLGNGSGGRLMAVYQTLFDLNKRINVEGGNSLPINGKDGYLDLNGIRCQKWKLNNNPVKSYWNCVNPDSPQSIDSVPHSVITGLNGAVKSLLDGRNFQLYFFSEQSAYNTFYRDNIVAGAGGVTSEFPSPGSVYSAVFASGTIGEDENAYPTYNSDQLMEVTAHEVGHAMDLIFGKQHVTPTYRLYVRRDLVNLDYDNIPARHLRAPCSTNGTAPFDGATFYDGSSRQQICTGGNLNSSLAGLSNSQILLEMDFGFWGDAVSGGDPYDPNAQSFAFQVVGAKGARPSTDQVFANGYFACIRAWADFVKVGNSSAPGGGSCGVDEPWYTPGPQSP